MASWLKHRYFLLAVQAIKKVGHSRPKDILSQVYPTFTSNDTLSRISLFKTLKNPGGTRVYVGNHIS